MSAEERIEVLGIQNRRLLRALLRLVLALAEWRFYDGTGGPTRPAYFNLRDAIDEGRKALDRTD